MVLSGRYKSDTPVIHMSGVGKTRAAQLEKLGIFTVRDLLFHFPRAYQNRGDVRTLASCDTESERAYILTVATSVSSARVKSGLTISKFRAFDDSGSVEIVFFNSPFVKDVFHVGTSFRFFGKCTFSKTGRLTMQNPKYEALVEGIELDGFVPIYPLTEGISSKALDKLIKFAINDVLPYLPDSLPEQIRLSNQLPSLAYAIKNVHFPENDAALEKAQKRLAFDEMLRFGLAISLTAARRERGEGVRFKPCTLTPLLNLLPYELTNSQKSAVNDIYRDTVLKNEGEKTPAMARIIVGDVGSGKTVCAIIAMYIAAMSGYQSALMVPTEILANQHFNEVSVLFEKLGIETALLTGSTKQSEKKRIYQRLATGELKAVIGTHALLSDKVDFASLGLIITDEQHRFGVAQRAVLKDKVKSAHMLVMSATPIPRTLALALYGDLDISRITEMPKGRMRVDTYVVDESYRSRINGFISKQVELGGQCYVVCPSIERDEKCGDGELIFTKDGMVDSSTLNLKNAVEYAEELRAALPSLNIACLHGKMKAAEKDRIMLDFASNKIQVLVSTTVIEVGVNVPNASLMIVENAERFGLSQLHQLRGRVGRGMRKSYCILISDLNSEKSKSRLEVMRTTYDGYEIADKDLLLRGPGDFFSSEYGNNLRQSGGFQFNMATRFSDTELSMAAFSAAKSIAERDPELVLDEHRGLREELYSVIAADSTIS